MSPAITHQTNGYGLGRNIWMPNLGEELHLWRLEGILLRNDDINLEQPVLIHSPQRALDLT